MAFTEQLGRKWSLILGSIGQAFAMYYIGVNQAVHPPTGELDGNAIFAIICVYLFVVFYSFGWGPIPALGIEGAAIEKVEGFSADKIGYFPLPASANAADNARALPTCLR